LKKNAESMELQLPEHLPLSGYRVLVTRGQGQNQDLCHLLQAQGAEAIRMPTIALRPPRDLEPLRQALRQLSLYNFLILTSANALEPLRQALEETGLDCQALAKLSICAIGPGTARALSSLGLKADMVPVDYQAEGILELFPQNVVQGKRILLPRAAQAREILPSQLRERGARVDVVPVYETGLPDPEQYQDGLRALHEGKVDILTFTSTSTIENFATILGPQLIGLCQTKIIVAIGPITRDACHEIGLEVQVMPETYTIGDMVQALVEYISMHDNRYLINRGE
jgi:uroporphyrinogen III methyltransferase/synthase